VRLRSVSSGWIRSAFFAVLALVIFLLFRRVIARSVFAYEAFAVTFLALPALAVLEEIRRRSLQSGASAPRIQPAPPDAVYERPLSFGLLAWPVAVIVWVLLPFAALGGGVNYAIGVFSHNVAAAMGSLLAVVVGALGGLAAWVALRTLTARGVGGGLLRGPLWREAPPASLSFRSLLAERLFELVYYYRSSDGPPAPPP
jgi:hypothetical protein